MYDFFATAKKEITDYTDGYIEVVPGYSFNQYETIKKAHLYYNSQFQNQTWYEGMPKLFHNIIRFRHEVAVKLLNFDTKDIRLLPLNQESEFGTFLLEKELELWLKKNKVGKDLNRLAERMALYGTCIYKKTAKGAMVVDLRRIFMDPTVDSITDSRFVTTKYYLTESQLLGKNEWNRKEVERLIKQKKDEEAKNTGQAADSYEDETQVNQMVSTPYYEVYERFGEVPKSFLTGKQKDENELVRAMVIYSPSLTQEDKPAIFVKKEWNKEWPFRDAHYMKTEGRYLGVGIAELLFEDQERINELVNQKRVSMKISSMHLFQTSGATVLRNLVNDLQNGSVISTRNPITPVVNEERNLPAFVQEQQIYDQHADRVTSSFDAIRGETLPATTPATNALIQDTNSKSTFAYKKENFGLMLQEYFNELVLPQLKKEMRAEHILRFSGTTEEIQKIDNRIVKALVAKEMKDLMLSGILVTDVQRDILEQEIRAQLREQGAQRFVKIKERMYDDLAFQFDILTTNEQENIGVAANNLLAMITAVAGNPGLLENPTLKTLLMEYAQKVGINPLKLEQAEQTSTPGLLSQLRQAVEPGAQEPVQV